MSGRMVVQSMALVLLLGAGGARAGDDPLEGFNRGVFGFNTAVIDHVIAPASDAFAAWIPEGMRRTGGSVYANLTEPEFMVTNLLAGNHGDAAVSLGRFAVNSTVGLVGLYDPASALGLVRRETEFGEALCRAGVPTEPYMVLPLAGPGNAWSAGLLTGFIVGGWYLLSMISPVLATADLVLDLSASAASLRHASDQPDKDRLDPYTVQKADYRSYLDKGCGEGSEGIRPQLTEK